MPPTSLTLLLCPFLTALALPLSEAVDNGICTYECIEDIVHNAKFVNLIVTLSSTNVDDSRLANYERLIPDEFRVFLRSESDRQKFIKNLGLTIQQATQPISTVRTTLVETETAEVPPPQRPTEEVRQVTVALVNGSLEFPVVLTPTRELTVVVHNVAYRIPADIDRIPFRDQEEMRRLVMELQVLGFPVQQAPTGKPFWSTTTKTTSVSMSAHMTSAGKQVVTINGNTFNLPEENERLVAFMARQPSITFELLEHLKQLGMDFNINRPRPPTTKAPVATSTSTTRPLVERKAFEAVPSEESEASIEYSSGENTGFEPEPTLQSTKDGRVVVTFEGQQYVVPDDLSKMTMALGPDQITKLVASLTLLGVPVEVHKGQIVLVQKPVDNSVSVQPIDNQKIRVQVAQSTFTLPDEADRLRLLWQQQPESVYRIIMVNSLGISVVMHGSLHMPSISDAVHRLCPFRGADLQAHPRSVLGPPYLWQNIFTEPVLLTQELARQRYPLAIPSNDVATLVEHMPSYELLTTTDGQLIIRVQGQTLQVPRDLPTLQTLVNPSMLVGIITRLQQIGVPVSMMNNRVTVSRETSTTYRIEVEVRSRGGQLISIVIVLNGQRFELPRDAEKFQQMIKSEPDVTFQLFKLLAQYHVPVELDQKNGMISFAFNTSSSSQPVPERPGGVPYTINSEQGKIVIHIANEAFEVPRDLQRLASFLDQESLLTIVKELQSFGAPVEMRGSQLVITRERTTSYRISLQVTTMRGQPIKATVLINQDRYELPAEEARFEAFLAKEPSINYKIFQLLSSKNIPISYDNESRRVRIQFASPAEIQRQALQRQQLVVGQRMPPQAMSASVVYGGRPPSYVQG